VALTIFTQPVAEPVTLQETKDHLRVDVTADDALISALITAARQHIDGVDGWVGRALITQTWDWWLDAFPASEFRVPLPPLQSVGSITYTDENGASQTWASAKYTVDKESTPGRIVPAWGESFPSTRDVPNAVKVRFTAGYGAVGSNVPGPIKAAMLLHIHDLYSNRGTFIIGRSFELSPAAKALLEPYRIYKF
jgi:uncharacterized phiE125 gp8 family phage protein